MQAHPHHHTRRSFKLRWGHETRLTLAVKAYSDMYIKPCNYVNLLCRKFPLVLLLFYMQGRDVEDVHACMCELNKKRVCHLNYLFVDDWLCTCLANDSAI